MMSRLRITTTLAGLLLLPVLPAWAQPTGSIKNMVEACGELDSDLAQLLESEVALVDAGAVSRNGDNTYRLTTETYTVAAGSLPLCPDSRFYGEKMVFGLPFRSAVQVGPDLVLTAWHGSTNGATPSLYAIFGLRYRLANGRCNPPNFERVPASDVYSVTEVVADNLKEGDPVVTGEITPGSAPVGTEDAKNPFAPQFRGGRGGGGGGGGGGRRGG